MIFIKWLINAAAVYLVAWLLPGATLEGFWAAMWLVVLLALANITIKPLLVLLTLPINLLTLGLFTLVIDALIIMLVASILQGFIVSGFWAALLFGLFLAIVNYLISLLLKEPE